MDAVLRAVGVAIGKKGVAVCCQGMRLLGVQAQGSPDGGFAAQVEHNHGIRGAYQVLAAERFSVPAVGNLCLRSGKVQSALVVCYLRAFRIGDFQGAKRLVAATVPALHVPLQFIGSAVVLLLQGLAHQG